MTATRSIAWLCSDPSHPCFTSSFCKDVLDLHQQNPLFWEFRQFKKPCWWKEHRKKPATWSRLCFLDGPYLGLQSQKALWPVIGASTSIIVFSCLRMAAPSLMIFSAASSSRRPSFTKWLFKTSSLGFPSSNTSFRVSRCVGGNGTAGNGSEKVSNTSLFGGKKNYSLFSRRLSFQASRRAYTQKHTFTEIMLSNTERRKAMLPEQLNTPLSMFKKPPYAD